MSSHTDWNNQDNQRFYEFLKPTGLYQFAKTAGISHGNDLAPLTEVCSAANHILEVGAGYGRVIDFLLNQGHDNQITAIEYCWNSYSYLTQKYKQTEQLTLVHQDICDYKPTNQFDLILHLWSGLADFPKPKQPDIVKKLAKLLAQNGTLVIDSYALEVMPLSSKASSPQSFEMTINSHIKYIDEPTTEDIKSYADLAQLNYVECIKCQSNIGRNRYLHVLKKT